MTVKTLVDAFMTRVAIRDPNIAADINNMQDALEQLAYATIAQAAFANVETLAGNKTLVDANAVIQMLNPNGANRVVTLPALAVTNHPFIVGNTNGASYTLDVQSPSAVSVFILDAGHTHVFFSDGVQWRVLGSKTLLSLSKLTSATNKLPYFTGAGVMALADLTNAGRQLIDDASVAAQRSSMGLQIGTNVQAYDADLDIWAGKTAPSGDVLGSTDAQTLTNKRVTSRTGTVASSATPTINTDDVDFYSITALAVDITSMTTNLSGTPTEAQTLRIAITGTATRAITWGASFEAGVPLPTTTNGIGCLEIGFIWNAVTNKWRCVGFNYIGYPSVLSIVRAGASPSASASRSWTVTFSESVSGVDVSDFSLVMGGGVSGATIPSVTGSGTTRIVIAGTGTGDGTLGLNLVDDNTIVNASNASLGGASDGSFTGEVYTIDKTSPVVSSIVRASTNPTAATSVNWTVTFSETVFGVGTADFSLVMGGGVSGATITSVTGSGSTRTVSVNTGTGDGTLGLNLVDDNTIVDSANNPLGGAGAGNGDFTGEVYTIDKP